MTYVYTMSAVRCRLNRGAKSVQVFLPGSGRLLRVTKKTLKSAARKFAASVRG
jgi:hypothetical protein